LGGGNVHLADDTIILLVALLDGESTGGFFENLKQID
jgi:hypothetical protein